MPGPSYNATIVLGWLIWFVMACDYKKCCVFRTERISVIFSFGKEKIDIDHCCQSFQTCFADNDSNILIVYDVVYHHVIGRYLKSINKNKSLATLREWVLVLLLTHDTSIERNCIRDRSLFISRVGAEEKLF